MLDNWDFTGDPCEEEEEQRVKQWSDQITFVCLLKSSESVLRQALIQRDKTKKKNRKCDPDVKSPSDPTRDSSQDRTGDYNDCWIKMRTVNFCFARKVDKLLCKISTDFHLRTVFDDTWKCLFTTRAAVLKCSVCSCSTLKRREDPLLNAK